MEGQAKAKLGLEAGAEQRPFETLQADFHEVRAQQQPREPICSPQDP
jgi:hypothetical protein